MEEFIETNPNQLNVVLETLKNHELCKNVAEKIHLDITYGNRGMIGRNTCSIIIIEYGLTDYSAGTSE